MTVTLSPLQWWDIPTAAAMDREIFGPDAWSEDFFWTQAASPTVFLIAAHTQQGLAGFAGLSISGKEAEILTIATHPSIRGRGAGRLLLESLLDTARSRGGEAVYLDVRSDNTAALGLYEAFGFAVLHTRPGYYTGADALVMRASLLGLEA